MTQITRYELPALAGEKGQEMSKQDELNRLRTGCQRLSVALSQIDCLLMPNPVKGLELSLYPIIKEH